MKCIRNFNSLNSAKEITLYSPTLIEIKQDGETILLAKDLGEKDKEMQINTDASGNISVEEKPTTETWYFNETINFGSFPASKNIKYYVNFTSNNIKYTYMYFYAEAGMFFIFFYEETPIYQKQPEMYPDWTSEAYRTIVLSEPATGNLLTFLQANATKQ